MRIAALCIPLLPVVLASNLFAQAQPATRPAPSATWSSPVFTIGLDSHGLLTSLQHPRDPRAMNWIRDTGPAWGLPVSREQGKLVTWDAPAVVTSADNANELRFTRRGLTITLRQSVTADQQFLQQYTLTNTSDAPVSLAEGDWGIRIPLPDNYPDAATALVRRCNVHVWTGGSTSWINATRMGGDAPHLGLLLREGSLTAYSITDRPSNSNDRGTFVLHPPALTLRPGQATTLAWSLFWHTGWDDFFATALKTPGFVRLQADRYTVALGQALHVTAQSSTSLAGATLAINGQTLSPRITGNQLEVEFTPTALGDQRFELTIAGRTTTLRAFAAPEPLALVEARVRFILDHQQKKAPGQPTDNAFLAFDNQTQQLILERTNDHNAGRERVGMGVLLALCLPRCTDAQLKARIVDSLNGYWTFITTHLQDATGKVFNDTDDPRQRLYNYPWVARLHLAMYDATREPRYLDAFTRTIRAFYANGGQRFYPIGLPIRDGLTALANAQRTTERDELLALFRAHADRLIATGMAMPKSEVNYEQSIVGPACEILLQTHLATGDRRYLDAATPSLTALLAFNGQQPDHHLFDIAIRHWDDYWFGKNKLFGDTFPHYWRTITALVLADLAQTDPARAPALRTRARDIIANNFSLFTPQGAASCAYVYPLTVNDKPGQFNDPWANDQDWALVHYLLLSR